VEGTEADVEKFRRKLKERGGNGILGLGRQFRVFYIFSIFYYFFFTKNYHILIDFHKFLSDFR